MRWRGMVGLAVLFGLGGGCFLAYDYGDYELQSNCPDIGDCKLCRDTQCALACDATSCGRWKVCTNECTQTGAAECYDACGDPPTNAQPIEECMCSTCAAECTCFVGC